MTFGDVVFVKDSAHCVKRDDPVIFCRAGLTKSAAVKSTVKGKPCAACWKQRSKYTPNCFEVARLASKSRMIFHAFKSR